MNTEIQITEIQIYKLQQYRNSNYRNIYYIYTNKRSTEIPITKYTTKLKIT